MYCVLQYASLLALTYYAIAKIINNMFLQFSDPA